MVYVLQLYFGLLEYVDVRVVNIRLEHGRQVVWGDVIKH